MIVIYCALSSAPETISGPWGPKVWAIKVGIGFPAVFMLRKGMDYPIASEKNESEK